MALQKLTRVSSSDIKSFKFENKGDTLKGYFKGVTEITLDGRPVKRTLVKTATGLVSFLGQADILTQLKDQKVSEGTWIEATFTGQAKKLKGGKSMKLYDLSVDREDMDLSEVQSEDTMEDSQHEEMDESEENIESDEVQYVPPTRPVAPAAVVSVSKQNHVKSLLSGRKTA